MLKNYKEHRAEDLIADHQKSIMILSGIRTSTELKFRDKKSAGVKKKSPKSRNEMPSLSIQGNNLKSSFIKEKIEKEFEENYTKSYVRKHAAVAKTLTADYKRNAINKALTEMYCSGDKYIIKNKELKEKS